MFNRAYSTTRRDFKGSKFFCISGDDCVDCVECVHCVDCVNCAYFHIDVTLRFAMLIIFTFNSDINISQSSLSLMYHVS